MDTGSQRGIKSEIEDLLLDMDITNEEIISMTGITYGQFYSMFNRTEVESRDAYVRVYKYVGHDGSSVEDKCAVCEIVLLKEYSITPSGWGEFQRAVGNVCQSCYDDISLIFPQAITALESSGCAVCCEPDAEIVFDVSMEVSPARALPLCEKHRRLLYEKDKWKNSFRDYYGRLDSYSLFSILDSGSCEYELPGWEDMFICPDCGHMSAWTNMLLGDGTGEHGCDEVIHEPGDGISCPECGYPGVAR